MIEEKCGGIVGTSVETHVESALVALTGHAAGVCVRMLGPLTITQNGANLELPGSRKVRALFAYLALTPHAVGRSRLCDLLWDVPNDPRGELRWCLSKLRGVLNEPGHQRIETTDDTIRLDLGGCFVDAIHIASAADEGIETLDLPRLRELSRHFAGDFLEGLEIDRSPHFNHWLIAQRRRFRSCHAAVLEHLAKKLPADSDEISSTLNGWVALAPFDKRAHLALLATLAERGQIVECEEHLATAARLFESEGLDFTPVREAWPAIKNGRQTTTAGHIYIPAAPRIDLISSTTPIAGADHHASLAVMPFVLETNSELIRGGLADGLTHDIITRLARLKSFFVIARGSVFALAERNIGPEDAGRRLNVDYVASGSVRYQQNRILVRAELVEVRTARIVWAEVFDHKLDDTFLVLDEIGNRIVSSISSEIELVERNRAILKSPSSLNAWEAYHRGLWHMYRFTRQENELAQHFFGVAVRLDPTFARAHAGLSFTHWQNAFQRWGDYAKETDQAYAAAGQSLLVDDNNPAAHWAMGRALWLRHRQDESLIELERAVELSPNFALGHYALSFVQSQSGDPTAAIGSSDHSRHLSPVDPLLFGMLGARAMAHVRLGQFEEAAEWALRAAARPNAHAIILSIAAHCLALAGRIDEAKAFAASIRKTLPQYCVDDFLATFQFTPDTEAVFRQGAKRIGLG